MKVLVIFAFEPQTRATSDNNFGHCTSKLREPTESDWRKLQDKINSLWFVCLL